MNRENAVSALDLMTINTFTFILIGVVLASLVTAKEVLTQFEPVKSNAETSASIPDASEMAKVFFTFDENMHAQIRYQAEAGQSITLPDANALVQAIERGAPKHVSVTVDARYPYQNIGLLINQAPKLGINLYMVAEHEQTH